MVQQAVPVATAHVSGDWQLTGAATFHEALDEGVDTPDDGATQAWDRNGGPFLSTIPPGGPGEGKAPWFEVLLGSVTDPGVTTGHVMRIRFKIAETTWPATTHGRFTLYQGSGLGPGEITVASKLLPDPGTTGWFTYEHSLSAAQAGRITDYADLRAEVQTNSSWTPSLFRVSTVDVLVPDPVPAGEIQRVHDGELALQVARARGLALGVNLEAAQPMQLWQERQHGLVLNRVADGITHTWNESTRHLVENHQGELALQLAQVKALDLRPHRVQDLSTPAWREHDMRMHQNLEATLALELEQRDLAT